MSINWVWVVNVLLHPAFIQARLCKIQGFFKDFLMTFVFKDRKLKKNTDLHVKILLQKC